MEMSTTIAIPQGNDMAIQGEVGMRFDLGVQRSRSFGVRCTLVLNVRHFTDFDQSLQRKLTTSNRVSQETGHSTCGPVARS